MSSAFSPRWVLLLAPVYVVAIDRYMKQPRDAYWQLGALLLGRRDGVSGPEIAQHLLGWLIKAFFLALMFVFATESLRYVLEINYFRELKALRKIYHLILNIIFLLDVIPAAAGYILTFRVLDSQIRSAEPSAFGWLICIMCYSPIWPFLNQAYFSYDRAGGWFAHIPPDAPFHLV